MISIYDKEKGEGTRRTYAGKTGTDYAADLLNVIEL